jgi:hypothetical protein
LRVHLRTLQFCRRHCIINIPTLTARRQHFSSRSHPKVEH